MHRVNIVKIIMEIEQLQELEVDITDSVEQSPSWEANDHSAKKFYSIYGPPKVHYHVHNSLPLVPILSQMNPLHTFPHYVSKIHYNIIFRVVSSLPNFQPKFCTYFSYFPCVLHPLPSSRRRSEDNIQSDVRETLVTMSTGWNRLQIGPRVIWELDQANNK
jgi:hypothetical protein